MITIDEKIAKVEIDLEKAKARYDTVASELEKLLATKKAMQTDKIIEAFSKSFKSYEEVLEFLKQ
jgi:hypothetical protein